MIVKVVQGKGDSLTNSICDNGVDVFSVLFPLGLLFIKPDCIINFFKKFMDSNTTILNTCKFVGNDCFENVVIFFGRNRFVFPLNHGFLKFFEFTINVVQRFFHPINNIKEPINNFL